MQNVHTKKTSKNMMKYIVVNSLTVHNKTMMKKIHHEKVTSKCDCCRSTNQEVMACYSRYWSHD